MGVTGLSALIKKELPSVIKSHPDRWKSSEFKGKKVVLDGSLLVNRLFFAGLAEEEQDPKRIVIGWHDLIVRMRQAGVVPIAVWDEPGIRDWKASEQARRAGVRSLHLSRSLHEEDRSKRIESLMRWVDEASALPQEELKQLGKVLATTRSGTQKTSEKVAPATARAVHENAPHEAPTEPAKLALGPASSSVRLQPSTRDISPDCPTTTHTILMSALALPVVPVAAVVLLATRLASLATEALQKYRPAQRGHRRDDLEVQTANFVESVEGGEAAAGVQTTKELEVDGEPLAVAPQVEWVETPRQTQVSEQEIELFEEVTSAVINAAAKTSKPSDSPILGSIPAKLADIMMQTKIVGQTHASGLEVPSRADHLESQELLRTMGVPVLLAQAPHEAEGLASHMWKAKLIDYVGTEDSDVLAYGATMLRHATDSTKTIVTLSGEDVRKALELDERAYLDYVILLGTDASTRIHDIGPKRALQHIKKYGTIENILAAEEKVAAKVPADFMRRTSIARNVFLAVPPLPAPKELEGFIAPEKVVQAFMRDKHGVIVPDADATSVYQDFDPEADHGRPEETWTTGWSAAEREPPPEKPKKRLTSRVLPPLAEDGLSLKHFVLRTEILKAYRSAVRTTRPLPDSATRRETLDWMRSDLERLRGVTDLSKIKEHLGAFLRTQKQFGPSLGLSIAGIDDALGRSQSAVARLVGRKRQENLLSRRFME